MTFMNTRFIRVKDESTLGVIYNHIKGSEKMEKKKGTLF